MPSHQSPLSNGPRPPARRLAGGMSLWMLALAAAACLQACSSVEFDRRTETSGTFTSTGLAFTILTIDLPQRAIDIARENASDAALPNMVIENVSIFPHLGPFDWLLDLLSVRYARISGHWGFDQ